MATPTSITLQDSHWPMPRDGAGFRLAFTFHENIESNRVELELNRSDVLTIVGTLIEQLRYEDSHKAVTA